MHRLPHCIPAIGSVPKNTAPLLRLITDARPINKYASRWRVRCATVLDICLMLTLCALMWIRDLSNAYHFVRLRGCRGADASVGAMDHQQQRDWKRACSHLPDRLRARRLPRFCDKSMFGPCVDGQVGRFAVCQFGHTVSNSPLSVLTSTICSHCSRVHGVDAQQFVVDLTKALGVRPHAACRGLEGNCPVCLEALERAREKMAFLDRVMEDCALEYSDKGDMRFLQRLLFFGIMITVTEKEAVGSMDTSRTT